MPRYCSHCILPDTRPGVRLDERGVCGGCRSALRRREIDWDARGEAFRELATKAKARGARYDCVVPVSGGKDSFWQVVTCLEHGLHPLCVHYVAPRRNAIGEANLRKLAELGVDVLEFRPNPHVERAFVAKAFRTRAISGLVTHMAIFALPSQVAARHGIPLVVYGENSAIEYGTEDERLAGSRMDRAWLTRFGVTGGTTAEDWIDGELTRDALAPYAFPSDAELAAHDVQVIFLGWFFPWDPRRSLEIATAHGFRARADGPLVGHYDFANIDDDLLGVHHHAKWPKFGITRSWDTLSMEIRHGRLSREQAIERLRARGEETPWRSIEQFCEYTGIPRREYFDVLERFRNREIWSRSGGRWRIEGFLVPDFEWPADVVA